MPSPSFSPKRLHITADVCKRSSSTPQSPRRRGWQQGLGSLWGRGIIIPRPELGLILSYVNKSMYNNGLLGYFCSFWAIILLLGSRLVCSQQELEQRATSFEIAIICPVGRLAGSARGNQLQVSSAAREGSHRPALYRATWRLRKFLERLRACPRAPSM